MNGVHYSTVQELNGCKHPDLEEQCLLTLGLQQKSRTQ